MTNLIDRFGINTHIDFTSTAYKNLDIVIQCLQYLGVKHIRDSANITKNVQAGLWKKVADATGCKFNAYLGQGSLQDTQNSLINAVALAQQGILESIEGPNEPDGDYSTSRGFDIHQAAKFQETVYKQAKIFNLPVINMSFGHGWDKRPKTGNYDQVGDLSAFADYGNAHTYPYTDNPVVTVDNLNKLAQISAPGKPVMTTELGWFTGTKYGLSEDVIAAAMDKALDECMKLNPTARVYLYELLDQDSSNTTNAEMTFGLFKSDGTPKKYATMLRDKIKASMPLSIPTAPKFNVTNGIVQISDPWAASHSGMMALNLKLNGTLSQLNAGLLPLKDLVREGQVFNQAGLNASIKI